MLKVENLTVSYGHVAAVRAISFEVPERSIVALVGANGAGKSSTLNALVNLVSHGGQIMLDGEDVSARSTDQLVRRRVVLVPQGRQLFTEMSTYENLELGGYLLPAEVTRQRCDEIMQLFPVLGERRSQKAGTLSGGEQQILAIARALMASPTLLLLDEPCLGLSPIMVKRIASVIRTLHRDGLTILLAEQNAAFAFALADRAIVVESGKVNLIGTPEELQGNDSVRKSYLGI